MFKEKAMSEQSDMPPPQGYPQFTTTHWSVVLGARRQDSQAAAQALEKLCRTYWYPLYVYLRRQGYGPHDAQDLTQGFLARFLEKGYLQDVDRTKGKFRSFLLASMKHYLANEWDRTQAQKRGGQYQLISWDQDEIERRYGQEPAAIQTAEKLYERRWATTLLETVLQKLKHDYVRSGKGHVFDILEERER